MKLGQILGELKGPLYRHIEAGERAKRDAKRQAQADSRSKWEQKAQANAEAKRKSELQDMGFRPV